MRTQKLSGQGTAKAKRQAFCIHCVRPTEAPEKDHVFPDSWCPDTTPSTVQRWTAPSCAECNRKFGQMEQDLLVRLVGCIRSEVERRVWAMPAYSERSASAPRGYHHQYRNAETNSGLNCVPSLCLLPRPLSYREPYRDWVHQQGSRNTAFLFPTLRYP